MRNPAGPAVAAKPIRSRPAPNCPLCGAPGVPFHRGLRDRSADTAERWTLDRCVDPGCRLLWLDPMPLEEDIAQAYHDGYYTHHDEAAALTWYRRGFRWLKQGYLAGRYGYRLGSTPRRQRLLGRALWLLPRHRADVDASIMNLPARSGGRLLEIGCGGGVILRNLRDAGWDVEGTDVDPVAVANARSKGLSVHLGRPQDLHLEEAGFDVLLLSHVLEHLHEPRARLADCRRLLKQGGSLVVLTPNNEGLCHRLFGASCFTLEPPRHLQVFNPRSLRRLVAGSGFTVTAVRTRSRGGRDYWEWSREIARTGTLEPGQPRRLADRLLGRTFEALEAALLLVMPGAGDEIYLAAEKRDSE